MHSGSNLGSPIEQKNGFFDGSVSRSVTPDKDGHGGGNNRDNLGSPQFDPYDFTGIMVSLLTFETILYFVLCAPQLPRTC